MEDRIMTVKDIFSMLGGICAIAGFVPYIRAILLKQTKPAKATWVIWATLDTITFFGMYSKHALNGQMIGIVTGVWVVVVLALKDGDPGWTKLDKSCYCGAFVGIILWVAFDSPVIGIMISLSIVFLGSIPTFVSAWKDPSREDKLAWTIYFASCIFTMFGIQNWTLEETAQPITFLVDETVMVYILYFHKKPVYLEISILEK